MKMRRALTSSFGPFHGGPGHTFHGVKALPKAPKVGESFFTTCKRDEEGHCLPGGGAGPSPKDEHAPTPLHQVEAALLSAAQKVGHVALSTQEAAKQAAHRVGRAAWDQLPPRAQQAAARTWKLARVVEHLASQGFHKGQQLAREAAKERGLSEEKVAQLGKVLALTDVALAWSVNFPIVTAATGSPWAGKASSWLPVASLGYVAYSLGRNPFKTLKAAGRVIAGRVQQGHKSYEVVADLAGVLAERFVKHPDPDWWLALFSCALDETQDLEGSVRLADELVEEEVGGMGEKSLDAYLLKSGFTGRKKDKLGREVCYKDGKRVPCTQPQAPQVQPQPSQVSPPPVVGRPTKPEERCSHCGPMTSLPWRAPPPPRGIKGGGKPERGVGERSQTALGDKVEALTEKIGLRNILPEGKRSHGPGEVETKGSTIDREWDSSGILVEIKTCRTSATEYKCKAKRAELEAKRLFAKLNKAKGTVTMIPVLDEEARELHLYWKEGLGNYNLHPATAEQNGWHYAGTVNY